MQSGESSEMVAMALCIRRATFCDRLALYRGGERVALKAGERGGRKPKPCGTLLKWGYDTVTMGDPLQIEIAFALWTRQVIAF